MQEIVLTPTVARALRSLECPLKLKIYSFLWMARCDPRDSFEWITERTLITALSLDPLDVATAIRDLEESGFVSSISPLEDEDPILLAVGGEREMHYVTSPKERVRRKITPKARLNIYRRDSYTCQYCGKTPPDIELTLDHITPVSKGGTNEDENLKTSCKSCNSSKGVREAVA